MSADTEEVTPPPDDTEEVTPPPDVTLGEEPQSEDQSSSSSCCCSLLCFPTCWSNSTPSSSEQPIPPVQQSQDSLEQLESLMERLDYRSSSSLDTYLNVGSPESFGGSMRSWDGSMEPAISFSLRVHKSRSMDPLPSSSGQQNPGPSRSPYTSLNMESPESLRGSMRSNRSMDQPISFREEPDGVRWLRPELKKYLCELVPDTDTMNKNLQLSDDGRTVTYEDDVQKYPHHPDRFHQRPQLLCRNALTGRCYWEVDWKGIINIAVSSRGIAREGDGEDCWFGRNDQSWSLYCSDRHGYTVSHKERPICSDGHFLAYHDNNPTTCSTTSSEDSNRAAVYVDVPAGTLSFFVVSGDELIHLHTFQTTFTDPLYPGFGFWGGSGASVSLPSV